MMVVTFAIILAICAVMLMRGQYGPPPYAPSPYPTVYPPPAPQPAPLPSYAPPPQAGQPEEIHEEVIRNRYTVIGATEETIVTLKSTPGNRITIIRFAVVISAAGTVWGHCGGRTPITVDQNADHPTLSDADATPVNIKVPVGVEFKLTVKAAGGNTVDYYIKYTSTALLR